MFEKVIESWIREVMLDKWTDITDFVVYSFRGCIFVYFMLKSRDNNIIIRDYMMSLICMSGYNVKCNVSTYF